MTIAPLLAPVPVYARGENFTTTPPSLTLGTLRSNDADGNEKVKKTMALIRKTTTLHMCHTILFMSFPFLHDYDVKMPYFAFMEDVNKQRRDLISLSELPYGHLTFSFRRVCPHLTK